MKDFRTLDAWKLSHELVLDVYRVTKELPAEERFGLTSQMRRCAVSIPSNIAEGCGRRGNGEFHKFLQISTGSASELEYQLLLSKELGYVSAKTHANLEAKTQRARRVLAGLINRVEAERLQAKAAAGHE